MRIPSLAYKASQGAIAQYSKERQRPEDCPCQIARSDKVQLAKLFTVLRIAVAKGEFYVLGSAILSSHAQCEA